MTEENKETNFISENLQDDVLLKILLIGDSGVGKTNIFTRFVKNVFEQEAKSTIGVEFETITVKVQGKSVLCQIWDTAGQERFRSVTQQYYRGASSALLVYDLTDKSTFESCPKWLKDIEGSKIVTMLVGNKCDLKDSRQVTTEEGKEFAMKNNLLFIETSALESENIQEAYQKLVEETCLQMIKSKLKKEETKEEVFEMKSEKITIDESLKEKEPKNNGCAC